MPQETESAAPDTESRSELTRLLHEAMAGPDRPRLRRGVGLIVAGVVVAGATMVGVGAMTNKPPGHGSALADATMEGTPSSSVAATRSATASAHPVVSAVATTTAAAQPSIAASRQAVSLTRSSSAATSSSATANKSTAATTVSVHSAAAAVSGNQILGIGSGLCISPDDSGAGARLELASCAGSAAEIWQIESDGTIRSQGLCMDLDTSGGVGDGTPVIRASCDGSGDEVFDLNSSNDLTSTGADYLCVDATDQGTAVGTKLQLWTCAGTDNQKWKAVGS